MDWLTPFFVGFGSLATALGLVYRNVRETHRADKAAAALEALEAQKAVIEARKAEQQQREAEQKRIEAIADRLQVQLDKAVQRLDTVENDNSELRTQQNKNIKEIAIMSGEVEQLLKDNQSLTKQVDTLRTQLDTKDNVIQEQDGRIKQQEKRIHELEGEYKRVKTQVALLVKQLKEAQLPLPDGVEHEGNGESGGGA